MVKGILGDNEFTNEYHFYDFIPKIKNDQELYYVKLNLIKLIICFNFNILKSNRMVIIVLMNQL